ncbi:MAG TPA: hypothetical protein VHO47_00605 [Candidatus Babeliales bacterium]|nr:hypothetical protein [Candidatus Babeliales bacterium]
MIFNACYVKAYVNNEQDYSVEGKISAFIPSSKTSRALFSTVLPLYEIQIAKIFWHWQTWLNIGYLHAKGRALGCNSKTKIRVVPVTFGLSYLYIIDDAWTMHTGIGVCWSFLKNKDYSPFVLNNNSGQTAGGLFRLGFTRQLTNHTFVDLFTQYLYQKFSFNRSDPSKYTVRNNFDISGFCLGIGFGGNF